MLKTFTLSFVILLSQTPLSLQTLPEWYRVYTFDDSIIELNTTYVMFTGQRTGRVRFRWSFLKPETLSREPQRKYQSRVEEIECDCRNKRFRLHGFQLYDTEKK